MSHQTSDVGFDEESSLRRTWPSLLTVRRPVLARRHRPDMAEREKEREQREREGEKERSSGVCIIDDTRVLVADSATGPLVKAEVARRG